MLTSDQQGAGKLQIAWALDAGAKCPAMAQPNAVAPQASVTTKMPMQT
jgi:hypothetical protein